MADRISPRQRSVNMAAICAKNTKPEMVVRSVIHRMGYRFRLHRRDLPGCPDIVFSNRKKVIFVHGCFWHQHPDPSCKNSRLPKSRIEYWALKLDRNVKRDATVLLQLKKAGWKYLVVWECKIKNLDQLVKQIKQFLD